MRLFLLVSLITLTTPTFAVEEVSLTPRTAHYATTHEGAYYIPVAVSPLGDNVTLDDGSIWSIDPDHTSKTVDWMTSDRVVIIPSTSWFSPYLFRLVNLKNSMIADANLSVGPDLYGMRTRRVKTIEAEEREVKLSDGSVWEISRFDQDALRNWLPEDIVLIGINDGWLASFNPNILINVSLEAVEHICGHVTTFEEVLKPIGE